MRLWLLMALLLVPTVTGLTVSFSSPGINSIAESVTIVANTDVTATIEAKIGSTILATVTGTQLSTVYDIEGLFDIVITANRTINVNGTNVTETDTLTINNVTIDKSAPSVGISSPTPSAKAFVKPNSKLNVTISISEPNLQLGQLHLQRTDGTVLSTTTVTGSGVIELTIPSSAVGFSELWLNLTAVDGIGHGASLKEQSILVDSQIPSIAFNKPNETMFTTNIIYINYTYSESNPVRAIFELMNGSTVIDSTEKTINTAGTQTRYDGIGFLAPDGHYKIRIVMEDAVGQTASDTSTDKIIFLDNTKPSVDFSLGVSSVYVGDSITPLCIVSDNSEPFGGNVTVEMSNIDTSTATSRTSYCEAEDLAGNTQIVLLNYTVLSKTNTTTTTNTTTNTTTTTQNTTETTDTNTTQPEPVVETVTVDQPTDDRGSADDHAQAMRDQLAEEAAEAAEAESGKKIWPYAVSAVGIIVVLGMAISHYRKRPRRPKSKDHHGVKLPLKPHPEIVKDEE